MNYRAKIITNKSNGQMNISISKRFFKDKLQFKEPKFIEIKECDFLE